VELREAVMQCIAPDGGVYLPDLITPLPRAFFKNMQEMSLTDIAYVVTNTFFGTDVDSKDLKRIVDETFTFSIPLIKLSDDVFLLEMFHGPTLTFKDLGARFMARLLPCLSHNKQNTNIILATNGNTGGAIANGFYGVDGVNVTVLFPHGTMSKSQESVFTTIGGNIKAIEVEGSIDDCKQMVASALNDTDLCSKLHLTGANSVNIGRMLPQVISYFHAYAQLLKLGVNPEDCDFAIPCGNLSNLTSGVIAKRMGLRYGKLIAGCNANNLFDRKLSGADNTSTRPTISTYAKAMDLSEPTNTSRLLDLYDGSWEKMHNDISSATIEDCLIAETIKRVFELTGYTIDPHTAVAYASFKQMRQNSEKGVIFATAHPAKSFEIMKAITGRDMDTPKQAVRATANKRITLKLPPTYPALIKEYLNQLKLKIWQTSVN
jgi:threonine synthase